MIRKSFVDESFFQVLLDARDAVLARGINSDQHLEIREKGEEDLMYESGPGKKGEPARAAGTAVALLSAPGTGAFLNFVRSRPGMTGSKKRRYSPQSKVVVDLHG